MCLVLLFPDYGQLTAHCFICINGFKLSVCFCASLRDLAEFARFAVTTEKNNVEYVSATDERIKPALSFHSIRGFIS